MRICLISREYPPDTGWGGIGAYTYQHAHGLRALGHDVEVVALAGKEISTDEELKSRRQQGQTGDVPVHRAIWGPLLEDLSLICLVAPYSHYVLKCSLALWQTFLKVHKEKPFDVIEAPEHLAEGLLPALSKIAPLVLRLHTPHSKFVAERYHNLTPSFDLQMVANLERIAMLESDVLSSPSIDLAKYIRGDFGYDPGKVEIVRNPVDATTFQPEGPKADLPGKGPVVLFAGRLEERKGIYHLISAIPLVLRKVPDTRFVVVGADTNTAQHGKSVLAQLRAKLSADGATEAVNFVGQVPLNKMADYYRAADISVVSSLYDNAPYTVLEAMACGKPIVGSAVGGIPEYIVDGETGLTVPPADPSALADAIATLLANAEKRRSFGATARRRIMENFEQSLIATQAIDTYELARKRFQTSKETALYRKAPELVIKDFVSGLYSYNESLSELVYEHAFKLNALRQYQMATRRPKLAFAKAMLSCCHAVKGIPVLDRALRKISSRLEATVSDKEREAQEKMLKKLFFPFESSLEGI